MTDTLVPTFDPAAMEALHYADRKVAYFDPPSVPPSRIAWPAPAVAWFNGGLFDDADALPLERSDVETVLAASDLDWSEVDPSILGTLFHRGFHAPADRVSLPRPHLD